MNQIMTAEMVRFGRIYYFAVYIGLQAALKISTQASADPLQLQIICGLFEVSTKEKTLADAWLLIRPVFA